MTLIIRFQECLYKNECIVIQHRVTFVWVMCVYENMLVNNSIHVFNVKCSVLIYLT